MAARDVLKKLNCFVDGRGYAGEIENFTPPVLTIQTEDFRAGGMDSSIPLDMGMEKLECSWSMISMSADIQAQFGLAQGAQVPLRFLGALESFDGTVSQLEYVIRGRMRVLDDGELAGGAKPTISYTVDLQYFRKSIAGRVIHEIDVENMIRIIDGVDQLAEQRAAIGL